MNLVNEAALMAARRNKRMVTQAEFEEAKDKVMMGAERKSLVMTEEEKLRPPIMRLATPSSASTSSRPIRPQGDDHSARPCLGMVMQLPERDKLSMSLEQMTSRSPS